MANCGCASGRGLVMQGEDPVLVTGSGISGAPFVMSLRHRNRSGCSALVACVTDKLGYGLTYDSGTDTINVALSKDANNALKFGSDGGLMLAKYGPKIGGCQTQEKQLPVLCRPAPADMLVGAYRMGGLASPFNSPWSADNCLALGVDIIHAYSYASSDGVACLMEQPNGVIDPSIHLVNQATYAGWITVDQFRRIRNMCGGYTDPEVYINFDGQTDTGPRRGGWWGWLSQQYRSWTMPELMAKLRGKVIILADCSHADPTQESRNVVATLRAATQFCYQKALLVGVQNLTNAATVRSAGVEPIMIYDPPTTYNNGNLPWRVDQMQAAGVKWVVVDRGSADSVFTTYRDNGFNVLMKRCERHVHRKRAENLLLCGYLSLDPVYTRGLSHGDWRGYRDPTTVGTIGPGMLTYQTDLGTFGIPGQRTGGLTEKSARGWCPNASPTGFGLALAAGWGGGQPHQAVSLGWANPLPNPDTYTIDFQFRFSTSGGVSSTGLLFGSPDDADPYVYPNTNWEAIDYPNAYYAYFRQNGNFGLALYKPDGSTVYLNANTWSATPLEAQWQGGAVMGLNTWFTARLTVTRTTVRIDRIDDSTGNPNASVFRLATTGPDHATPQQNGPRGGYLFHAREETGTNMETRFRVQRMTV